MKKKIGWLVMAITLAGCVIDFAPPPPASAPSLSPSSSPSLAPSPSLASSPALSSSPSLAPSPSLDSGTD